jgi:hypothetical protein
MLAAEFRVKLLGPLARGFDAKAPPFDVEKVADGTAKANASLGVLLETLHFFLSVGADGGKAMLVSEMAWQLIGQRIKAHSLSLN